MPGRTGRPPEDDAAHLARMADLVTGDPPRRPHSAAVIVVKEAFPTAANPKSYITRLCRKYKLRRAALEADAEERRHPKPLERETVHVPSKFDVWGIHYSRHQVKKPEK